MQITERQQEILQSIIQEYIQSARPVGSQSVERKYRFGVSPATIRIEMQKLTNDGYLLQPHTSAGRVPTDKAYRFFVDKIFVLNDKECLNSFVDEFQEIRRERKDNLKFIRLLTKSLASASSGLAMSYLSEEEFFWKEGWQGIFQEPEFKDFTLSLRFVKTVDSLEEEIVKLISDNFLSPRVYIGKENPFVSFKDFSMIISKCCFPESRKGALAILGPKRMSYQKNIGLINSVVKLLQEC